MGGDVEELRWAFANLQNKESCWILCGLAHGYVQAALATLRELKNRAQNDPNRHGGVFNLLPVMFGLHHGLELFLKGALLFHGMKPKLTHDLRSVLAQYNESVAPAEFGFAPQLVERVCWLDDTCRGNLRRYTAGTAARYLHGQDGKLVVPGLTINETKLTQLAAACQEECVRIHILMVQQIRPKPDTWLMNPLNVWWEPEHLYQARRDEALRQRQNALRRKEQDRST